MAARRQVSANEWQYRSRSSEDVRGTLLTLLLAFIRDARHLAGVERIALVGSLATDKPRPEDADVLVTITPAVNLAELARVSRRFKGRAQGINSTADIFLANADGDYLGRVCSYRECHPRALCAARHCGRRPHLNDDLDLVTLTRSLVEAPPVVVYPGILRASALPADVERVLLGPLGLDYALGI